MFVSQKALHKRGVKSFAHSTKQSGLMSLSGLSFSLLAWGLGSPQVFLTKQEKGDEEKKSFHFALLRIVERILSRELQVYTAGPEQ